MPSLTLGDLRSIRATQGCTQLTATITADGIDIFGCCLKNCTSDMLTLMQELGFVRTPSQDEKLTWKKTEDWRGFDSTTTVRVSLRP